MAQSRRVWLHVAMWSCFIIGLFLFLNETDSAGGAIERFRLILTASLVGATLLGVEAIALTVLRLLERRKNLKHRQLDA